MMWAAEQRGGFWYTVHPGRVPTVIMRRSEAHAVETAQTLNRIDSYQPATFEETPE